MTAIQAEYDEPWKEAIRTYLNQFLSFFFPDIQAEIDWQQPYQALDKELSEIVAGSSTGKQLSDLLFQVKLLTGQPAWILIHVEVQSKYEPEFNERIYRYNYRAFDKYSQPVVSLAVLGDERPSWRPNSYQYTLGNYRLSLEFPTVKLLDYQEQWAALEAETNPFAIMVMAHLKTKATTQDYRERKRWKGSVVRTLLAKGYNRDEVVNLFRFVDKMMQLPDEFQQEFNTDVIRYQEERTMPFISRLEEMAEEKGYREATKRTLRSNIGSVLEIRFNAAPEEVTDALNRIDDPDTLRRLHQEAVVIPSVAQFLQLLAGVE